MKKILSALAIAGIFISGCAQKGIVKETAQPQQQPQKQIATTEQKQMEKKESQETVASKEVPVDSLRLIREMQAKMKDIHFDFDKYEIRTDETPILKEVAETLRNNSKVKVTIEGNCDERGTDRIQFST
ncbi:MAG TPA: hypothetical protein DCP92_11195 [Nitrospiraceae bacterium]|nr:hypothetical protein [Nitrospiraceae bacterium]